MAADLLAIATRIEREPPSRELDAEIALATGWEREAEKFRKPAWRATQGPEATIGWWSEAPDWPPKFTTSRDAAAGLMPAGWIVWEIGQDTDTQHWHAHLMDLRDSGIVRAVAPIEPQARTAAALRATAALKARERGDGN